jgi:hypothetical protein
MNPNVQAVLDQMRLTMILPPAFSQAHPGVSEHPLGRANEVGASGLVGGEADHNGGGVGERDVLGDR